MVSGFLTSPCDHDFIFSGDAIRILIASNEAVSLGLSNSLYNFSQSLSSAVAIHASLIYLSSLDFNNSTSSPRLCNSLINTLKDSGSPGVRKFSPLTTDSYILERPGTSSDLTVRNSCSVAAAPWAPNAQPSISPSLWPPNWALPPRGCWVTRE